MAERALVTGKRSFAMFSLTGHLRGILVKVEDGSSWRNLELAGCVVVGGPTVRFSHFEHVAFVNCVFLYDGMEVEGHEWIAFMSRERVVRPAKAQRRGH
jgi:hypothetical protein